MVGGAYTRDKNTCARTLAENVLGGLIREGGAYMRDTTVYCVFLVAVVIAIISSIRISTSAFTGSLTEATQRSLLSKGCLTYW